MSYSNGNYSGRDFDDYPRRKPSSKKKRRKRRKRILQAILPAIIAIVLIVIVLVVAIFTGLFEGFAYSSKEEDLYDYFGASSDEYAVIIENGQITENTIRVVNGFCYIDFSTVKSNITERFYYDVNDNALLYTTSEKTISTVIGSTSYEMDAGQNTTQYQTTFLEGDTLYIALDYIALFNPFSYTLYGGDDEPYRAEIKTEWGTITQAKLSKDQAIRVEPDKKSNILVNLENHDTVIVIDEDEEWSLVQTQDLIPGYIENKFLKSYSDIEETKPILALAEPAFNYFSDGQPINLVWDMIGGQGGNDYIDERFGSAHGINVISPTWFSLSDNDGNIASIASSSYVEKMHSKGIKVWGLVDNISYDVSTYEILSHSSKRAYVIDQLINYAKEYNLDGINVDFESLSADAGEPFIQFIRELFLRCRKEGLVLSSDNYVPKANTGVYNRDQQGLFLDYLIIMGYDEHYVGSEEIGSVASLPFVTEGIEKTLEEVPAERVINAVPLYTRIWIASGKNEVQTVGMADAINAAKNNGATITWDDGTGQNYAEWVKEGSTYKVWLEDTTSLRAKLEVMKAHNLAGLASWQLGYATSDVWDLFSEYY